MMRLRTFSIWIFLFIWSSVYAQNDQRQFVNAELKQSQLYLELNDGTIIITPYSDTNLEVHFIKEGTSTPFPSYAIADDSHSDNVTFKEHDTEITFSTAKVDVKVTKSPFQIKYYHHGELLLSEEQGFFSSDSISGFRFHLDNSEQLMGGGERAFGKMDRRGNKLKLYNQASYGYETHAELMYYSMPLVISSNKYMLGFDNGASGWLDLGSEEENILQFDAVGGRMSYFIVVADTWKDLAVNFTELTGRQPMLPRWSLGNISSRMGYRSQEEVENVINKYIEDDIPLDGIVLDLYWFGPDVKGHMGNLEWDLDSFPEPQKMLDNNRNKGVKTVLITEPFILNTSKKYQECADLNLLGTDSIGAPYIYDFYFGTTALLDIFKPEAKEWFWNIYKKHTLSGVDGWWGDLGEPEVHPPGLQHVNGRADDVHNIYGHEWAQTVYEGYQEDFPDVRPLILMRSGFIGSQRYGMIPWSGDVNRTWGGLQSQVEISLQMSMQGLAYMHSDLGGFAGIYKDAELYTRWLQYGTFQPVYRTHAQEDVPPEPIFWDDTTKAITRDYIKLRYQLMPYNYTLMHENSTTGVPMMRPLLYAEDKTELLNETNTYLWGEHFLVSPIVKKGITSQKVYLPYGSVWVNYFTGEKYSGGQYIDVKVDIENIPVFVKAGAFIPMTVAFQNTEKYNTKNLTVHYYHDQTVSKANGYMYNDDGKTKNSYQQKKYEDLTFESYHDNHLTFKITPNRYSYDGMPDKRNIELVVHHFDDKSKYVKINGKSYKVQKSLKSYKNKPTGAFYDSESGQLHIRFVQANDPIEITTK